MTPSRGRGIVIGSDSDLDTMLETVKVSTRSTSAARWSWPPRTARRAAPRSGRAAPRPRGSRVLIAAAGGAAALPGVVAALLVAAGHRRAPAATPLTAWTPCCRSCRCPRACRWPRSPSAPGARPTPACLAAPILALGDAALAERLAAYRKRLAARSTSGRSAWPRRCARRRRAADVTRGRRSGSMTRSRAIDAVAPASSRRGRAVLSAAALVAFPTNVLRPRRRRPAAPRRAAHRSR